MHRRRGWKNMSPATMVAALLVAVVFAWAMALDASAFTLRVTDPDGNPVQGFRWLLEVDNTHPVDPGAHIGPVPVKPGSRPEGNPLALSLHRSYSPIVLSGSSATNTAAINFLSDGVTPLPRGRYMVSVLPYAGYTIGGKNLVLPQDRGVRVIVAPQPIATAQIAVKVFHDIRPTNNAPDVAEVGLPGFSVLLFDTFGQVTLDAFGNPLGTTYKFICDATGKNPGTGTSVCLRADGSPFVDILAPNSFEILSDANGEARIKYLVPGKYGIQVVPPAGQGWHQTTTIEGTPTIDAWVRPNEPPFLVEFGPPFWHAFYGFVQDFNAIPPPAPGEVAVPITGQVLKGHVSRPPAITFHPGAPPSTSPCLVALNVIGAAAGETIYAGQCVEDGFFTIPDVPPGLYQLVVWDTFLDMIIYFTTVSVPDGAAVGAIPVPMWFAEQEHHVFGDTNANGFRDPGEAGIPDQNVNLRFRDGSVYQAFPTDATGYVPFEQVFPFFKWQVAEVDFATKKATGLTVVVDDGGVVTADEFGEGKRTPQPQATDGSDPANEGTDPRYRLQTGPVLTQAYQNFAGQNLRFEWGKTAYAPGENGGISGIVRYATTRAENNPALSAPDNWEPGIPRVQVNLYQDRINNRTGAPAPLGDGRPDDRDGDGVITRPDVDNHPLGFSDCTDRNNDGVGDGGCTAVAAGPEDVDRDGDGLFDLGDAYRFAHTDSWDDSLPSGCRGDAAPVNVHGKDVPISDCAEGLRTWNQVRPGVFDGGYAFGPNVTGDPADRPLRPGAYIVEAVAPPGYEHQKEEDKNVELGDPSVPSPLLLPAPCVGAPHVVPPYLSLQTDEAGNPLPGILPRNLIAAPFAGQSRPLCDRKKVSLSTGQNAAADFYLFTKVPKSARVVGLITDDLANELAPGKPSFTEKFSPGWLPISLTDYSGREIIRFYDDEFGAYNALVPSTHSVQIPIPTGVSPMMHHLCLNHPGPIPDGAGGFMTDPQFKRQYSTTCYNFDFWPGKTTYLDTPVIRIAAFVGALQQTLDCEFPNGTPLVQQVINNANGYPAYVDAGQAFTITSVGLLDNIPNPAYPGVGADGGPADPPTEPQFISRNYGFGANEGEVRVGTYTFPADTVTWSDGAITVAVPAPRPAGLTTGQLIVVRANGDASPVGLTLQVGLQAGTSIARVSRGGSIQAAVDAAADGDLILVDPGIYHENVIVYKKVRLQGAGTATVLDAKHYPGAALQAWRTKLAQLNAAGLLGLLPGQDPTFQVQEGPGFLVIPVDGVFTGAPAARIDGFTVVGADLGGGIFVNAYAHDLEIGNNRILNNQGTLGGGVRVGSPSQINLVGFPQDLPPSPNTNVVIHHNQIIENGSLNYGGGVAIFNGATGYRVESNTVCGNLSRWGGGGLSHYGLSDGGRIASNQFFFNEVFQGNEIGGGGGGIEIRGEPPAVAAPAGTLSPGTGSVAVVANLIQGNLGGAADGGGIALRFINGQDVTANPGDPTLWYRVTILNNQIVNNATGLAGAGISLQDAARVSIIHNTVAHNDSAATAADAFAGNPNQSTPQPAGIVSRLHSNGLGGATGQVFSDPELVNNIVWHNRSFFWMSGDPPGLLPNPAGLYQDLGVIGSTEALPNPMLSPGWCVLSDTTGYAANNSNGPPFFLAPYLNTLQTAAAADEGGNFVQLLLTPLSPTGDYHIGAGSAALDAATNAVLADHPDLSVDFDGDARPDGDCPDIGADEATGLGGTVPGGCGPLTFPTDPPDPPVAVNDLFAVNAFNLFAVPVPGVLANDSDADGDVLSATLVPASLSRGSLSLNPNGSFSWAPPSTAWVGSVSFRYVAGDGVSQSGEATVTLNKDLSVMQADFDRSALRWLVRGATTAPVGTQVTVYLGPLASGQVIGVATVARNTQGALRWRLVIAGGSVPRPHGIDTVSAKAATGAEVLGAPLTAHP